MLLFGFSTLFLLSLTQAQDPQAVLKPVGSSTIDNNSDPNRCVGLNEGLAKKSEVVGKNWIVVTTINPPTDAMNLLCNLPEWNVVVVADTKSSSEWKCGTCVYLTVGEQQCLGFGIVPIIPFKAYTRKNIGYLWAIKQGATTVFDTDDDNLPTSKEIIFEPSTESFVVFSNATTSRSVNIYSHFGRPDVWPRGFPLPQIDIHQQHEYLPSYGLLPDKLRDVVAPPALIQQGLADLDPDVDAIFRLTRQQELKRIKFCQESPSIRLAPGTFCPFNSQMSFRVCDIWRGYWVQRLLWDVNGSLAFTKPTVEQIRNAHNYLDDFKDEIQLYTDTTRLIDFLANWTSTSTDLETRIVELMMAMAAEKFIGDADVDLAQRWIKDLQSIGYKFPRVAAYNNEQVQEAIQYCHRPIQRTVDAHIQSQDALKSCYEKSDPSTSRIQVMEDPPFEAFKDVLLVVNFNKGGFYSDVIPLFLDIYKNFFPNIVFYGYNDPPVPPEYASTVKVMNTQWGEFGYMSLVDAMEQHQGYKGYLHTNDDVILNVHQLANYDKDKVWKSIPRIPLDVRDRTKSWPDDWWVWGWKAQDGVWNDTALFTPEQRERLTNFTGVQGPADVRAWADAFYVPSRLVSEFVPLMHKMREHEVHLELAVGPVLLAIEPTTQWVPWKEEYLWDNWGPKDRTRDKWQNFLKPGVGMLHSVKLSAGKAIAETIKKWLSSVEVL
ncbi:hypothetical protein CPC16_000440 [Podila verticillata]|nr:hypothetical protein CPC16_000439 [Podila verticillata]KAF9375960.1 hypothetical protein CPC16_000440 [Podila verticillata]